LRGPDGEHWEPLLGTQAVGRFRAGEVSGEVLGGVLLRGRGRKLTRLGFSGVSQAFREKS
jgi:hypothetical protein